MTTTVVNYDDLETIKKHLVGRRIVSMSEVSPTVVPEVYGAGSGGYEYTLDDGTKFYVFDADGGCACSNGCFYVTPSAEFPKNVITAVDQTEKIVGESGTIRLFVYSEGIPHELFNSEGSDNGYYGWGHHIAFKKESI